MINPYNIKAGMVLGEADAEILREVVARLNAVELKNIMLRAERGSEVYQERRYQFIGKKQFEYWADIEKSSYQYLPESERRIIYVLDQ